MFKWIKRQRLIRKFKKEFQGFNAYTLQAMKLTTDEQLKEHCLKCIDKIAKDNNKDIESVSLEDIYRVLYKIRKKTPKLLREIKLSQMQKTVKSLEGAGDISSLVFSIAFLSPIPALLIPIKKVFGKKIKYVIVTWVVSLVAKEIYGSKKND